MGVQRNTLDREVFLGMDLLTLGLNWGEEEWLF
jgi:hypothetical protein